MEPCLDLLGRLGFPTHGVEEESRSLVHEFADSGVRYILCRPTDVPAYVEHGAADLGIVGKDIIVEQGKDVFEMVDLGSGTAVLWWRCRRKWLVFLWGTLIING
jgi:ATP phosphoribosyltransferase